ncbi:hypothetical protein AB0K02_15275 [Streptomyces sp. NPDC049597]
MITVCRIEDLPPGESHRTTCPPAANLVGTHQASPADGHVLRHVTAGEQA